MKISFRRALLFLVLVCFSLTFSKPLNAQFRGSFQGTVTDTSGAVIPNATVTLTSTETNISRTASTNDSGVYTFTNLAPGHYDIKVEQTGFTTRVLNNILLASEQAQSQDIQLEVGQQTVQTVTVNASEGPALDTETATVSATFSNRQVQALPTFGRDTFQVAALAPGTFGDNSRGSSGSGAQNLPGSAGPGGTSGTSSIFATENQVQISSNGTRNASNDFQVDGVSTNSLAWGGASVITPNKESVKEVSVQSNPYSAENGRNSGAQVLVVSQNGTNQFHGSALMKFDRPGLNAYQRWNGPNNPVQKDTDRFNQWAGSLGGPIIKSHLFFFFSYETLRNSSTSTALGWYETPQFLKNGPAGSIAAKILGFPGEGASFNAIIPKTCSDAGLTTPGQCQAVFNGGQYLGLDVGSPLRSALGTQDPGYVSGGTPGIGSGLDGIPDIMYVQSTNPTSTVPTQYNGRVDYQATGKDLIVFTTFYVPNNSTFYNGPARPANLWNSNRLNETAALLWTHTFSAAWINEARFNVTRWAFNEIASNPQEPWGLPTDNVDALGSAGLQFFGAPGPGIFAQTTYNYRDTVSTVQGNHSIKAGVDIYKEQDNDTQAYAGRPSYSFRNLWDLANDAPYLENGNFNPKTGEPSAETRYIRSAIYAGFVQDDWKPKSNLTLNLGLRWEYFTPVSEKYGNISNPIPGSGPNALTDLTLRVGGNLYNASKNNWGPEIGFAWRPNPASQRFVIRGGFGIGYNRMQEAITLNGRSNPPLVAGFTLNTPQTILYQVPSDTHQFYNWPINPNAVLAFGPNGLPTTGAPIDLTGFPNNLPTPLTYRDSLETQYDLGGNFVAKLGYQGSLSRHNTRQTNLNLLYYPNVNPRVAHLNYYINDANGSYNALLTELEHRFAKNFQLDFQYRWSKTLDDGSNDYVIGQYPFGIQYLKGPADFDVTHNVKLYGVWTPTILKGHGFVGKVLGGWQLSGILNWHSGFPWTPIYNNTGCNLVYPNSGYCNLQPASSVPTFTSDSSNNTFRKVNGNFPNGALAYFGVPSFPATGIPPAPGVGRNSLRGPTYFDTDATLQKSFGLPKLPIFGENARFEFRGDLFNIFNKLNLSPLGAPSTIISNDGTTSNPLFGQAQSALSGRVVELQVRFSF
ncbi:MAG: TonB-dependent receptor [Acidobacteriota bacterium]|nr:TonB-dependent receptor [Acidobacteriota bacterium]